MTVETNKDLNRRELFRKTKHLYSDPKNYEVYVSEKTNPELNLRIKNGEVSVTLQDLIDAGFDAEKLSK